ncbi:hypothetical protein KR018_004783 [Drosophila ironensis]|nr:hypothetical protein KR018_004783 [Drosophila ironensis]
MKINEKNLCVFARTPPYDMEGCFLSKRGEVNKAFQRRYFVLKGNLLFYFENRTDKEPLGLIIVEGCTIELSGEADNHNYGFEIAFNGNRTYILAADDQESMEAWMKALTCAGYEYKRIVVAELQRQLHEIEESKRKMLGNPGEAAQKPKPPPRRTNPFNRPAPPPPTESALRTGTVLSPMPFINGYFGSSNARLQQEQLMQDANGNASPQGTPKVSRRPPASVSVFYSQVEQPQRTVLPRNSAEAQRRRAKVLEEFVRNHEGFRKELMPEVTAYRERQGQPLIDL